MLDKDKCFILLLHVESKNKPIATENRLVVARGKGWGVGKLGENFFF